ncbi:MAG: OmpA family protein [Roseibium sp.]|uniref:OmpA family protein n=1 Tax=Roseibium sp. TaxID=1936156 RepID=UPI001B23B0D7|nr:OmpA family protein [Roseibium sp.]MBO6892784.1 OmpA family protein [Roseibium sp.]MBO6928497.1 OmpA family protein [Roseibium sp.]
MRTRFSRFAMVGLLCGFAGMAFPGYTAHASELNVVALQNGAVLISQTSEFGDRASAEWIALALIDGNSKIGWSSAKNRSAPNEFVFELASDHELRSFSFDNTHTDEPTHPGISARSFTVLVSDQAKGGPYWKVAEGNLVAGDVTQISLDQPVRARRVKLVLSSNGGHPEYTELMEFSAFGAPLAERQKIESFSGVYQTNWGPFFLTYNNRELSGCYDHDNGNFTGKEVGGVMNIEWREDNDDTGSAVLAITSDGAQFNGLWYRDAKLQGTWTGTRSGDQSQRPKCAAALVQSQKSQVAQSLDSYGTTRLYGIYFDFDSDVIKPQSAETLEQVAAWLRDNPGKSVIFEGHTDSKGSDAYNQTLSAKRAAAVVRWLTGQGLEGARLAHNGFGEQQPVADNATENGRSLNRRVEMKVLN